MGGKERDGAKAVEVMFSVGQPRRVVLYSKCSKKSEAVLRGDCAVLQSQKHVESTRSVIGRFVTLWSQNVVAWRSQVRERGRYIDHMGVVGIALCRLYVWRVVCRVRRGVVGVEERKQVRR